MSSPILSIGAAVRHISDAIDMCERQERELVNLRKIKAAVLEGAFTDAQDLACGDAPRFIVCPETDHGAALDSFFSTGPTS